MPDARDLDYRRMIAARDATRVELAGVQRQIIEAAESAIRSMKTDGYAFPRGSSDWRASDEAAYRAELARLNDRRSSELGALRRKVGRQTDAIRKRLVKRRTRSSTCLSA